MEFPEGSDVDVKQDFVEMGDKSYQMMIQYSVGVFCVICNELATEQRWDEMVSRRYLRVRIWTVKFPGDIWTAEIWTLKPG